MLFSPNHQCRAEQAVYFTEHAEGLRGEQKNPYSWPLSLSDLSG